MADRSDRFKRLPERPAPEVLVTTQNADLPPDEGNEEFRNIQWQLKHGGI